MATQDPIMATAAGRYAAALFDLAHEENRLADVEKDLATVQALYDESDDLRRLVRSPVIASDDQARAINALSSRAGLGTISTNFLKLIVQNRRLFTLPDMLKAFRTILAKHRGEVAAEVTSAVPLKPEQLTQLKDTLKAQVGKDVQVSARVDPGLLGGLVVKIGSRMIDSSLRTKLNLMKTRIKEVH